MDHHDTIHTKTTEELANIAAATVDVGGVVRWNHLKTIVLVGAILSLFFCELIILIGGGAFASRVAATIGGENLISWPSLAVIIFTVALAAPVSQAADYWGRKWLLVVPNIGGVAGAIISARATSFGMYIAGFCVGGIGFSTQGLILTVSSEVLPRKYRSFAQTAANMMNALGSIFALALGGYLVQSGPNGFRTYFYICAGIYAVAIVLVLVLYNPLPRELQVNLSFMEKLRALDWGAYFLLASGTVLFCLGLLFAENPYPWRDAHVYAPLVVGGLLLIATGIYSWKFKKDGLFHHDLFLNRNYPLAAGSAATEGLAYMAAAVFFPYAIGVLPAMDTYRSALCQMVGFVALGVCCPIAGYYIYRTKTVRVPAVGTFVLFLIFFVLMATVDENTPDSHYWGYILFYGVGLGLALVTFTTLAQFSTPPHLIATTTGIFSAGRSLGGAIGLAIFNAIFANGLTKNLVPKVTAAVVPLGLPKDSIGPLIAGLNAGDMTAVEHVHGVTPEVIAAAGHAIKQAYVVGFRDVFITGGAFAILGIVITLFIRNPTNEFSAKIDAPIEIFKDAKDDREPATSEQKAECEEVK